jgi:hypothetical protein
MAKIYRTTDIIPLEIDGLVVNISPLTFEQKMQIQTEVLKGGAQAAMRAAKLACQSAIKEIKGIEDQDGTEYKVQLTDGRLSDETWDDLQNIEQTQKLITVCLGLINGIPKEFVNPETGEKLKGVTIIREATKGKKK